MAFLRYGEPSHLLKLPITVLFKNTSSLDIKESSIAKGHCNVCLSKSNKQLKILAVCVHRVLILHALSSAHFLAKVHSCICKQ